VHDNIAPSIMLTPCIYLQVVRELHVIDWSDAEVVKVPYRSIRDYIASSTKPCAVHRGISSDDLFDQKVQVVR